MSREVPVLALSPEEAAKSIGIGLNLIHDLIRDERIPHVHVGSIKTVLPVDLLDQWLKDQAASGIPLR